MLSLECGGVVEAVVKLLMYFYHTFFYEGEKYIFSPTYQSYLIIMTNVIIQCADPGEMFLYIQ